MASLESKASLTGLANRHIAYKAEQLRDFFFSEWDVISALDLADEAEFRAAIEDAFRTYAYSLLRSRTEAILAFDGNGALAMDAGLPAHPEAAVPAGAWRPERAGWFEKTLFGEVRVGVAFQLEPIGWTVAVTELKSTFMLDARSIQITHAWILLAAVAIAAVFLAAQVRRITRPLEQLAQAIGGISASMDLTQTLPVEYPDEIGSLAAEFNIMVAALRQNYGQLETTAAAERAARQAAVAQETETLLLLSRLSDFRDEETGQHLRRIGAMSVLFSRLLGQGELEQRLIRHSAPLHDIGKIGIDDAILRKPGKLSAAEFEEIKRHTVIGHELLKDSRSVYLAEGATIALTHHERWDGSGYPRGLSGEAIPLNGRIVSLVDVFDALTSVRPYKQAWSPDEALASIARERGTHFDPRLVDLFTENFQLFLADWRADPA